MTKMRLYKVLQVLVFGVLITACKKKETTNTNNDPKPPANDIYYQTYSITSPTGKTDSMFYDLNNDMVMDIVAVRNTDSLPGVGRQCSGKIYSIKEEIFFTFLRTQPAFRMLDTTDFITNSTDYSWIDTISYISNSWNGIFTPNFGFQHKTTVTNFGWFHFDTGRLKESAINKSPNLGILFGQKK